MYFVKETLTTFPYLTLPVSRYWAKDGGISDFRISGQSFINENCHNSGSSHDIDTKLGPVTELDKRNMANLEKFHEDVKSANCNVIVFNISVLRDAVSRSHDL